MSETTIDSLQIEVSALSDGAVSQLNKLKETLSALKTTVSGISFRSLLEDLSNTTNQADKAVSSINKLKEAFDGLREHGKVGLADRFKDFTKSIKIPKFEKMFDLFSSRIPQQFNSFDAMPQAHESPISEMANQMRSAESSASNTLNHLRSISSMNMEQPIERFASGIRAQFGVQLLQIKSELDSISQSKIHVDDAEFMSQLNGLRARMEEVKAAGSGITQPMIDSLQQGLAALQNYHPAVDETNNQTEQLRRTTEETTSALQRLREVIGNLTHGSNRLRDLFTRIAQVTMIRSLIRGIIKGFREGMNNLEEYGKENNTPFYQAIQRSSDAFTQLKNSIAAAASPILTSLTPAFITLTSWIIAAVNALNQLFSLLAGAASWTGAKAVSARLDSIGSSAGGAGKKMQELLADFDELNIIQSESGGGGGGGSAGTDISSMFEEREFAPWMIWVKDHLDEIKSLAIGIGAAFLAWKVSRALGLGLADTLKWSLGIGLLVTGIAELWQGFTDQLQNGINWENLKQSILGVGVAVLGLGVMFGLAGVGWGLLVGGLILSINPLKEFIETGDIADESMIQLTASVIAVGAGISLLTGSWIPLALAGIAVTVGWIVKKWDAIKNLDWRIIPQYIRENVNEIKGILTDVSYAGIAVGAMLAFSGVNLPLGIGLIAAGAVGLAVTQLDWNLLSENVDTAMKQILQVVGGATFALGAILAVSGASLPIGIGMMVAGAATAIGATIDWGSLIGSIQESWNEIVTWAQVLSIGSLALGAVLALSGVAILPGIAMIAAGVAGIYATADKESLMRQLKTAWEDITKWAIPISAGSFALGLILALTGVGVVPGLAMMAAGVGTMFATDSWGSLLDMLKQGWNDIVIWAKGLLGDVIDFTTPIANFFIEIANFIVEQLNNVLAPFDIYIPTLTTVSAEQWKRDWGLIEDTVSDAVDYINSEAETILIDGETPLHFYDTLYQAINDYTLDMIDYFPVGDYYQQVLYPFVDEMLSAKQIYGDTASEISNLFYTKWMQSLFDEDWEGSTQGLINILEEAIEESTSSFSPAFDTSLRGIQRTLIESVAASAGVDMSDVLAYWDLRSADITNYDQLTALYQDVFNSINEFGTDWKSLIDTTEEKPDLEIPAPDYSGTEGAITGLGTTVTNTASTVHSGVQAMLKDLALLGSISFGSSPGMGGRGSLSSFRGFIPSISFAPAAAGGLFDEGEFFMAREQGPELVGQIGHKTAVANNKQIEGGISLGVKEANEGVERGLDRLHDDMRVLITKSGRMRLEPSTALARTVKRSEEMRLQSEGI